MRKGVIRDLVTSGMSEFDDVLLLLRGKIPTNDEKRRSDRMSLEDLQDFEKILRGGVVKSQGILIGLPADVMDRERDVHLAVEATLPDHGAMAVDAIAEGCLCSDLGVSSRTSPLPVAGTAVDRDQEEC